jgi:hypothetical protein
MKQILSIAFIILGLHLSAQQQIIESGHSHNDYTHEHPLFDALGYGYKSIEIDVWLHKGKLIVDHNGLALDSGKKDIEELYLRPIQQRVKENNGWVYKGDSTPTIFMVEFKSEPEAAYVKLKELIEKYKGLFCDRLGHGGPIKLLITGNRPWASLRKGNELYITADGAISQSTDTTPPYIIERVSDPYGSHFTWHGKGTMPKGQKAKLDTMVKAAHDHGRQIRFYAAPQDENVWRTLLDAGVDWINADDLGRFATFYKDYIQKNGKPKSCHCVRM